MVGINDMVYGMGERRFTMVKPGIYNTFSSPQLMGTEEKMNDKIQDAQLRIAETEAKAVITEQIRTQGFQQRLRLREVAKERARGVAEVVEIDANGELVLVTKNTFVQFGPRIVTNLRSPDIVILYPLKETEPLCYQLNAVLGERQITIFLDSSKVGRREYLQGKFTAAGVVFHVRPQKIYPLLQQLIGKLVSSGAVQKFIPETPGWIKVSGEWKFYEEGGLTWKKIKQLMK